MNSIYFYRLVVVIGSIGLISPVVAGSRPDSSGAVSTDPGSGPISASTRYDYGSPLSASSSATSGSASASGGQGSQSTSAADPTHYTGSGVTTSRESKSTDAAHPGEKVAEVDLHALPTSGTDAKFQGTLLNLSVKSIDQVRPLAEKTGADAQKVRTNAAAPSKDADEKEHKAAPKEKPPSLPDQAKASPTTNR